MSLNISNKYSKQHKRNINQHFSRLSAKSAKTFTPSGKTFQKTTYSVLSCSWISDLLRSLSLKTSGPNFLAAKYAFMVLCVAWWSLSQDNRKRAICSRESSGRSCVSIHFWSSSISSFVVRPSSMRVCALKPSLGNILA